MLRIYDVMLELVRNLRPLVEELERRDADLARQCRRALFSAPLNLAEGSHSRGKNRGARYHNALGSLREALACFETAAAFGYIEDLDVKHRRHFDQCSVLWSTWFAEPGDDPGAASHRAGCSARCIFSAVATVASRRRRSTSRRRPTHAHSCPHREGRRSHGGASARIQVPIRR